MIRKAITWLLLLLAASTASVWVASYFGPICKFGDFSTLGRYQLDSPQGTTWGGFNFSEGKLFFVLDSRDYLAGASNSLMVRLRSWLSGTSPPPTRAPVFTPSSSRVVFGAAGFKVDYRVNPWELDGTVRIPLWMLFSLFFIPAAMLQAMGTLHRWRCRNRNHCLACNYNLAGLTEPRCPECGIQFDAKEA